MKFPNLSRLSELKNRVGPTLKELKVEAKLGIDVHDDRLTIYFENRSGSVFVPVWIKVANPNTDVWEGCDLITAHWSKREVGHNGWWFYRDLDDVTDEKLGPDVGAAFDDIRTALVDAGSVQRGDKHANKTDDYEMVRVFERLEERLSVYDDIFIECKRNNGVESLNFIDPLVGFHAELSRLGA